jgi:5-methylcytosine-specific restriction protein A
MASVCVEPGCPNLKPCSAHRRDRGRPNATDRGYGPRWKRNRARYLNANPTCIDCGGKATVPDHDPVSRRELVARGDPNPDAWHHLKPRCKPCHDRKTGRTGR